MKHGRVAELLTAEIRDYHGMEGDSLDEELNMAMDGRICNLGELLDIGDLRAELNAGVTDSGLYLSVWTAESEEEADELIYEFEENPEMTSLGIYELIEELVEDMQHQGFTEAQLYEMSHARYGRVLEIVEEPCGRITAFIGNR